MPPRKRQKATRLVAWPGRDAAPLHERFAPRTAKDLRVYPKTVERVRAWLRRATGRAPDPGAVRENDRWQPEVYHGPEPPPRKYSRVGP